MLSGSTWRREAPPCWKRDPGVTKTFLMHYEIMPAEGATMGRHQLRDDFAAQDRTRLPTSTHIIQDSLAQLLIIDSQNRCRFASSRVIWAIC